MPKFAISYGRPKKVTYLNQIWSIWTNVTIVTICDHMWPPVARWYQTHMTCDNLWPGDTKSAKSCGRPKKGNISQPNLVSMNTCGHCNHQLPTPVTYSSYSNYPLQFPIPVIPVTHSRYSSYPLKLFQLPTPVTPFIQSSHPLKLLQLPIPVTPVTHSSYSSYPLQLLQLTTSIIPITNSSYPIYYKHPKFQPDHW